MTTVVREATRTFAARSYGGALALALFSASSFGLSGSLARSLLDLGWSPAAVVATRVGGAFLILLIPCLVLLRRLDYRPVASLCGCWRTGWSRSLWHSSATSARSSTSPSASPY